MPRSETTHNTLVGLGVFVGTILFVAAVFINNMGAARWKDKVSITADFRQVSGLKKGSPVQLEGIEIGTVIDRQFIAVDYPCDPETEDRGRFGQGRSDDCDGPMFCAPEGKCAELIPYSFTKTHYQRCQETAQCQEHEVCVTPEFRRRYRGVIWSGTTDLCAPYLIDHQRIRVELAIYAESFIHVRDDSRAVISQNGVLGDQLIQISMGRGAQMKAEGRIQTVPATIEQLDGIKERFEGIFGKVEDSIGSVAELAKAMGDEKTVRNVQALLATANASSRYTAEGKGTFGALLNDESYIRSFSSTLRSVRETTSEVKGLMRDAESTMRKFDEDLPPAVDKGRRAMARVSSTLKDVRDPNSSSPTGALLYDPEGGMAGALAGSISRVRRLSDGVLAGEGTLGRLLTDPKGYDDLVRFFQALQRDFKIQLLVRWARARDLPEAP